MTPLAIDDNHGAPGNALQAAHVRMTTSNFWMASLLKSLSRSKLSGSGGRTPSA
jgi:hypothetical protein